MTALQSEQEKPTCSATTGSRPGAIKQRSPSTHLNLDNPIAPSYLAPEWLHHDSYPDSSSVFDTPTKTPGRPPPASVAATSTGQSSNNFQQKQTLGVAKVHLNEDAARISFIVRIEDVVANFGDQGPNLDFNEAWDPPRKAKDLKASNARFFWWTDGSMKSITVEELLKHGKPVRQHNVGSVFNARLTDHLLITDIDAAAKDVSQEGCDRKWSRLYFHHMRVTPKESCYYTELGFMGMEAFSAAPLPACITPQLLPSACNDTRQDRINGGLVGKLPLLIALAVSSASREYLADVMTSCIRPGRWRPHKIPPGREEAYGGVVIHVCYHPSKPMGSTTDSLQALEKGNWGPFTPERHSFKRRWQGE